MQVIRLKNLRSFIDTVEVPIRELNLFVGQNSSGKSTFLRTFPLLRQSVLRDTRGPILWYDDTLVDFGSFEEAKSRHALDNEGIHFGFKVKLEPTARRFYYYHERLRLKGNIDADIDIEIFEKNKKSYIGNIAIEFEGQSIYLEASESGNIKKFVINKREFPLPESTHYLLKLEYTGLIPLLFVINKNDKTVNREFYLAKCKDITKKIVGQRLKNDYKLDRMIQSVTIGSKADILNSLKKNSSILTWFKKVQHWDTDNKIFNELNDLILAHFAPTIMQSIDEKIKRYFEECKYIAPIRAKAIRYYRRQDLSVSEVDAYGDNLHMFLDNLNPSQLKSYQKFVMDVFNFKPSTQSSQGHITLNIEDSSGEVYNITDLGFGYSQILPIITKLWYAYSQENHRKNWESDKKTVTILIEQPELHLHPAMQAQLADAFIYAIDNAKKNKVFLKLIVETHSSVIINRIGRRVIDKSIESSAVNVTLFQQDKDLRNSKITTSHFNDEGVLNNWPIGFFEPKN
jgi:predicted ATPase